MLDIENSMIGVNKTLFVISKTNQLGKHIEIFKQLISENIQKMLLFGLPHEISNNMDCATSNGSDQPAHTCSLIRAFAHRLNIF